MTLLALRDISKVYHRGGLWGRKESVQALSGVSLELEEGRCLAVIGPSGSGKSTLGRLVLGLEKPDSGDILYKGTSFFSLRGEGYRAARRNIQVVFQNSHDAVNPRFSVLDIIGEPLRNFYNLRGKRLEQAAADLLAKVGLHAGMLYKRPHQLSGGELQRVCIARALGPKPEIIVLDEAVSSLDMLSQSLVLDLLESIKAGSGAAFLFISHDLRVVSRVADSLAVIKDGKLAGYAKDFSDPAQVSQLLVVPAMQQLAASILTPFPVCR